MSSQVLVSLFITVVLLDIVQVFTTDDNGTVHLGRDNHTTEDTSTDGDLVGSKGTLLINVFSFDRFLRSLESKTNVFEPSTFLLLSNELGVFKDTLLELVGFFVLVGE
jgi:hypothetical protein